MRRLPAIADQHNASRTIASMDLKQLEYFVRVAELGSFTRAAAELDVAQPALSRQVRLLEVELRQALLLRNGRGAVPRGRQGAARTRPRHPAPGAARQGRSRPTA